MFSSKSEYDRGVNTFSPEGRIYQLEYALEAVKRATTSLGVQTSEGVVLAAEKPTMSKLMEPSSLNKIHEIDHHVATVLSGMVADARLLVDHARVQSQGHRFTYNEPMPVESVALSSCDLSLRFGEGRGKKTYSLSRPFGVSLLIGGVDDRGPQLWHTDPTGAYTKFEAKAIGAGAEAAQTTLEEKYYKSISLAEAEKLVVGILKSTMEDKLSATNIEVAVIRGDASHSRRPLEIYDSVKIQTIIDSL